MKKVLFAFFISAIFLCKANADLSDYTSVSFWNKFNDDILINNLLTVYQNNNDLKASVLKVQQANRIVKMSFADELPYLGFHGYVGQIFHSSDEIFGDITIPDYTQAHFLFPLEMNYEIDIWGKNRLKTKSKKKQLEMLKQDEKASYIYISSAFSANYFNLVRCDKLIEYQKQLIDTAQKIVKAYELKYEYGRATLSDIEKAKKNLTFLEQDLEKLLEKQDILKNQLNVFMSDRTFSDIKRADFDSLDILLKIPSNIEFEVLDNRPDRVKSRLDLEKIGLEVKIARREMLPRFIISGNLGFNMYSVSSAHNFLADIGIIPIFDIFSGGRKIQMLKLKKDKYEIAIQNYEKTILTSIKEANDALYCAKTAKNIEQTTNARLKTDEKELDYTIQKIDAGTMDNLDLLFQKQRLIVSKMQNVSAKTNVIISALNLYQALGGVDFSELENI
mgnify:CR=1 FL=1